MTLIKTRLARHQRWVDRHFNPNDPAHCNTCFQEGERRIVAGVVDGLRARGVLSPKPPEKLRMAKAGLRPRVRSLLNTVTENGGQARMQVHIRHANGLEEDVDDSRLVKTDGTVDNAHERTTTVEYCLVGCDGRAHLTGIPDAPSHFCHQHVHRSVHVTIKEWPRAGAASGTFT